MMAFFRSAGLYIIGSTRSFPFCVSRSTGRTLAPCSLCGRHYVHTSAALHKQKKHTRKKIEFSKKGATVINIWRNITPKQIAENTRRSLDDIFEAMLYVEGASDYDHEHAAIEDPVVVRSIVERLGLHARITSAPHVSSKNRTEPTVKDLQPRAPAADPSSLPRRPAVVTIMGHVDHGKTTLLDALRNSRVVDQEFGGITQHIGAFSVTLSTGARATFLDTPGHAAFAAMRRRGALVTDAVVLVVAADDGVMPQTRQSIEFAREAGVPLIVAINKCDRDNADVEATKKSLLAAGVQLEEQGGDVIHVQISALTGAGLDNLTDAIVTLAEMRDLRAERTGPVEGHVLESTSDPHRGKLATVLVRRGTLRRGAALVAGSCHCRVRVMLDEASVPVTSAPPSSAVQVSGWRHLPSAGDLVLEVASEREAQSVAEWRRSCLSRQKAEDDAEAAKLKLEQHLASYREMRQKRLDLGFRYGRFVNKGNKPTQQYDTKEGPVLYILIKGDVDGSVEAILDTIETYDESQVRLELLHHAVGDVTLNDINMASAFGGVVYAFNVQVGASVQSRAATQGVKVRCCNVIYRLIEDVIRELDQRMPVLHVEDVVGEATVLQEFMVSVKNKKFPVVGCRCISGQLKKQLTYRLLRDGEMIFQGELSSMRHLKSEVSTVSKGVECGLMLSDLGVRVLPGDSLICYQMAEKRQTCRWNPGFQLLN